MEEEMADKFTKELRSRNMKAIRSKETKLEQQVAQELWKRGFRFRKNVKKLFGTPDISIKKYKVVVFLDSFFWHGCQLHGRIPENNREYWIKKIKYNQKGILK